jgi:hypothetical protein
LPASLEDHQRQIINGCGLADESGEGFVNAVADAGGGTFAVTLHDFDQGCQLQTGVSPNARAAPPALRPALLRQILRSSPVDPDGFDFPDPGGVLFKSRHC